MLLMTLLFCRHWDFQVESLWNQLGIRRLKCIQKDGQPYNTPSFVFSGYTHSSCHWRTPMLLQKCSISLTEVGSPNSQPTTECVVSIWLRYWPRLYGTCNSGIFCKTIWHVFFPFKMLCVSIFYITIRTKYFQLYFCISLYTTFS